MAATEQLLEEVGFVALTMEDVAQLAGVGKATIYRRWPTKGLLAFETFRTDFLAKQPVPDTGSLRGDLLAALRAWIRTVDGTVAGRTLRGLIAEVQRDSALGDAWRDRFVRPVRGQHRILVARGIDRGDSRRERIQRSYSTSSSVLPTTDSCSHISRRRSLRRNDRRHDHLWCGS